MESTVSKVSSQLRSLFRARFELIPEGLVTVELLSIFFLRKYAELFFLLDQIFEPDSR